MKQVFLFLFAAFIVYCCSQGLEWDSNGNLIAHSYSIWGDWSVHFTFISNLRERGLHWLMGDNPVFQGMPFQYPFLSHVITALFGMLLGLDVIQSTYWLSLILLSVFPFALYFFFTKLKLKPWTAVTAVALYLFLGGLQIFDQSLSANEPLTNQFQKASIFTQPLTFEFFPQRAFLFGILIFCWVVGSLLKRFEMKASKKSMLLWLCMNGLFISLTSWLHLHTWITFAVLILSFFIFRPTSVVTFPQRRTILFFGIGVATFSGILISLLLMRGNSNAQGSWDLWFPGWAQNSKANIPLAQEMNFLWFWVYNTGFFLPLAAWGAYLGFRKTEVSPYQKPLFFAGILLFALGILINIQPYFYDNLKIFTYSFLLLTPFAAFALEWLWNLRKNKAQNKINIALKFLVIALITIQCTSAIKDIWLMPANLQSAMFFSKAEFELAEKFKSIRHSAEDLVLIVPRHNHWVPCLTGNPIVMGYPGWLWSWQINYAAREKQVQEILLGLPQAEAFVRELGIKYIVVNPGEPIADKKVAIDFLSTHYQKILTNGAWSVFEVK